MSLSIFSKYSFVEFLGLSSISETYDILMAASSAASKGSFYSEFFFDSIFTGITSYFGSRIKDCFDSSSDSSTNDLTS